MKVVIDPGHGERGNPYPSKPGYYEGTQMFVLAGYLSDDLKKHGFEVIMTRQNVKDDPDLSSRGSLAKGAAMFVSLHSNAVADSSVRGCEVFYSVQGPQYKPLAAEISSIVAVLMGKIPDRGAKTRQSTNSAFLDYYTVLYSAVKSGCTCSFIVEHGFHTNDKDAALLCDEATLRYIAFSEAEIIAKHFGVSTDIPDPQPSNEVPIELRCDCGNVHTIMNGVWINGSIFTPVRALGEGLGYKVDWDGKKVIISRK